MNKTLIPWVKNPDGSQGYTLNSKTGCLNHTPEGLCLGGLFPCYAHRLANGRLKSLYLANTNWAPPKPEFLKTLSVVYNPFYPRFWPERLAEPCHLGKGQFGLATRPRGIFLDDMSDWMGDYWPREWTEQELQMMRDCPQHRIYTLTKQAQNLIKFSPFPDNCWVGVTVTNEGITYPDMMEEACRALAEIKATVKYLSFEPLLSSIYKLDLLKIWGINWVIIGAQTKPYKPPEISWVEEIVRACGKAGVPVFLKNNLKPLLGRDYSKGIEGYAPLWAYTSHKLRQETPE